jgi:hypothetical protein
MKVFHSRARGWLLAACSALAVVACGGGGGTGATSGASATSTSSSPLGLSLSLMSPASIRDVTYEGLAPHQVPLVIGMEGDTSVVAGRPVYFRLVQPDGVYLVDPFGFLAAPNVFAVSVVGNEGHVLPPGRTTGTLRLQACLDRQCSAALQSSPVAIDYEIEVRPGLSLSPSSIQQSTNYAAAAAPRTISVSAPPDAAPWFITPARELPGANASSLALVPQWLQRSGDTLTFQPPANLLPGTYGLEFQLDTVVPDPVNPSVPKRLVRTLTVSHTVVATGAYAITPASEQVTASIGGQPPGSVAPELLSQVGGSFSRLGVRTDAFPAAAAGDPMLADWLTFLPESMFSLAAHSIRYCDPVAATCLPPGTYRGALLLRHTATDGAQTDFEFPVTLMLDP